MLIRLMRKGRMENAEIFFMATETYQYNLKKSCLLTMTILQNQMMIVLAFFVKLGTIFPISPF